jgi:acetyl esterase/lipase
MAALPIASDLTLDASRFRKANAPEDESTASLNTALEHIAATGPKWWVDGAAKYRERFEAGETPLPKPVFLAEAKEMAVTSRDADRTIPLRRYEPDNGQPSKAILLHIHGGGFVFGSHK